jgi:hypothetical protein
MATQPYLDATRNGSFTDPAGWTTLADLWEGAKSPAYTAEETQSWVDVKIEVPVIATVLTSRGITPEDIGLIADFIDPAALIPLEDAIGAIAVVKGLQAAGLATDAIAPALVAFFNELSDGGVDLSLI